MKIKLSLISVLVIAALLLAAGVAYAQAAGYDLSWWTVDGGGGQSSGAGYILLNGTAGQADTLTLSGDGYTLDGGFWGGGAPNIIAPFTVALPLIMH